MIAEPSKVRLLILALLIGADIFSLSLAQAQTKLRGRRTPTYMPATGLPAWVAALPVNRWYSMPNTALDANLPNQQYGENE